MLNSRIALAACLVVGGCGDDKSSGGVDVIVFTDVATTDSGLEVVTFDVAPFDAGPQDTGAQDVGSTDTGSTDTGPTDTGPADTGPTDVAVADADATADDATADTTSDTAVDAGQDTAGPTVNDWGVPCTTAGGEGCACDPAGDACAVGLTCADTALGHVCAEPCVSTCSGERRCAAAAAGFNVCLPAWTLLCAPCTEHADCLELGARCVDFGFAGRFCGNTCDAAGGCPDGFSCFTLGAGDDATMQCLPDSGECACTPAASALNADTACFAEGGVACTGIRSCGADGLTDCNAPLPGDQELCNNLDDDCNNMTDEGFDTGAACADPLGGCADGMLACSADGTGTVCQGASGPTAEVACDGVDENCNGMTDEGCDDDGDGYCDESLPFTASPACPNGGGDCVDEGPGAAAIHPDASETCDNIDNDCSGSTDGHTQSCTGTCGNGTETCTAGNWAGCTATAQLCDPSDPCCKSTGCAYEANTVQCSATPHSTGKQCSGSCGGTVQERTRYRYCTGSSAGCGTGNLKWTSWGNVQACGSSNLCSGGGNASCTNCAQGCSGGQCITQPTHVVCIDPRYGGAEPGPVANGLTGKNVTLNISNHLKDWLNADTSNTGGGGRWSVVMTRTGDSNPSNTARVNTCNNGNANRVIAIGINAFTSASANGAETYRKSTSNATWQNYAQLVQTKVIGETGFTDRGVKTSTSSIVASTNAPSALVYPGFLTNGGDSGFLSNNTNRKEIAKGLLHALQQTMGYSAFTP